MTDEKGKVQFSGYPEAPRLFVNGVWGGALTEDHLVAYFMFKHITPPDSIMVNLKTGETLEHDGVVDTNEIQCAVIMTAEVALSIGKWFVRHAKTMQEQEGASEVPAGTTVQ